MLKGKGKFGNRDALIFGLSHKNIERLMEDKPILIMGREMGVPFDILIFAGKDEVSMAEAIKTPETIVVDIPKATPS